MVQDTAGRHFCGRFAFRTFQCWLREQLLGNTLLQGQFGVMASELGPYFISYTRKLLQFDGILEGAGQDVVYATCANEVAESLLAGYNGTIFCYGQVSGIKLQSINLHASQAYHHTLQVSVLASCHAAEPWQVCQA